MCWTENIWGASTSGVCQGVVLPDTVGFIWENGNSCEILGSVCAHLDDLKGQTEIHCFFSCFFLYFFPCLPSNTSTSEQKATEKHLPNTFLNLLVILWVKWVPTPSASTKDK